MCSERQVRDKRPSSIAASIVFDSYEHSDMKIGFDRDPACTCFPDVFLYFKGFHAIQTYRVAHYLWKSGRQVRSLPDF